MSAEFHFITNWKIKADKETVYSVLSTPLEFPLWWPAVYLEVEAHPDKEKHYLLHTKGWLPYSIKWSSTQIDKKRPDFIEIAAMGDFEGKGKWTFTQESEFVLAHYDWRIKGNKPLFKYLAFLLRPLFSFNHHWAMNKGMASLQLEIDRLRKGLKREEAPTPPLATFPHRKYYKLR